MTGKKTTALYLMLFASALFLRAGDAQAMLRVLKYRDMTEIRDKKVCVFAKHEMNPKKENQGKPMNGKEALVCRVTILANKKLGPSLSASTIQTFPFDTLTKTCVDFSKQLKKTEKLVAFGGLQTECGLKSAASRISPSTKKVKS